MTDKSKEAREWRLTQTPINYQKEDTPAAISFAKHFWSDERAAAYAAAKREKREQVEQELATAKRTIRDYKYAGDTPGLSPDELTIELGIRLQRAEQAEAANAKLREALSLALEQLHLLHDGYCQGENCATDSIIEGLAALLADSERKP